MSERKAVTKHWQGLTAPGDRARKGKILDKVAKLTGWHPDYAKAVLCHSLVPATVGFP